MIKNLPTFTRLRRSATERFHRSGFAAETGNRLTSGISSSAINAESPKESYSRNLGSNSARGFENRFGGPARNVAPNAFLKAPTTENLDAPQFLSRNIGTCASSVNTPLKLEENRVMREMPQFTSRNIRTCASSSNPDSATAISRFDSKPSHFRK